MDRWQGADSARNSASVFLSPSQISHESDARPAQGYLNKGAHIQGRLNRLYICLALEATTDPGNGNLRVPERTPICNASCGN